MFVFQVKMQLSYSDKPSRILLEGITQKCKDKLWT